MEPLEQSLILRKRSFSRSWTPWLAGIPEQQWLNMHVCVKSKILRWLAGIHWQWLNASLVVVKSQGRQHNLNRYTVPKVRFLGRNASRFVARSKILAGNQGQQWLIAHFVIKPIILRRLVGIPEQQRLIAHIGVKSKILRRLAGIPKQQWLIAHIGVKSKILRRLAGIPGQQCLDASFIVVKSQILGGLAGNPGQPEEF